tara:strand:- start:138 stop:362 length:225 start_codon:yes stop_codon:yes gene_type:complete
MTIKKRTGTWSEEKPLDTIVRAINEGHTDKEVYDFLLDACSRSFKNKQDRQDLADQIAQVRAINVFAKSTMEIT